jgi:3-oxoacyl-[acyl-carrier protein] reductase
MYEFEDYRVIVSGAGTGIGFAIAKDFAQAGAVVGINDINEGIAVQAARLINDEIGAERVYPYALDVADVDAVRVMVADFTQTHGTLNVMVANAGITIYGPFLETSPEAFDRLLSVNLRGTYFSAQAAAQHMVANQVPGRIILMSSMTGHQAFKNLGAYGISKAGVRMMAKSLALELGSYSITVNAISPGPTLTERTLQDDSDFERNWASVTPTGRAGYVEDIASACLFLATPGARHITGQTLLVDGGWTIHSPMPAAHPDQPEHSSQLR